MEVEKRKSVPTEQAEGWTKTRDVSCRFFPDSCSLKSRAQRVSKALVNILGVAEDVGHEALVISSELLEFAPLPGLRVAALALLDIWEALQMVDVSALVVSSGSHPYAVGRSTEWRACV